MKKALLLGGTGALGVYLTEELLKMGYKVDVVSLEDKKSDNENLTFIKANVKENNFAAEIVKNGYDVITDFMIYFSPEEFAPYCDLFLNNCSHYIFLSSYRVYADSATPITEESDRLLDISDDEAFLKSGDYSVYKAQQEDMLHASGKKNFTILRPAITYTKARFQLTTLEAKVLVRRMRQGKTVVLPEGAMDKLATLSWAGDFGKTVSRLVLNPLAFGEAYTISTSEYHTWREIAEIYKKIGGLKYVTADTESYLNIICPNNIHVRQQLTHDRYFNRRVDNSKLLRHTGLENYEFMPLEKGLKMELEALPDDYEFEDDGGQNARMDEYLKSIGIEE